jgi:hypothetical protein
MAAHGDDPLLFIEMTGNVRVKRIVIGRCATRVLIALIGIAAIALLGDTVASNLARTAVAVLKVLSLMFL